MKERTFSFDLRRERCPGKRSRALNSQLGEVVWVGGGCWYSRVTHTLGVAVPSSVHHFVSGLWSRSGSFLSPRRGVVTAACGSAAPGTELNEWRRDARSEVRTAAGGRLALRGAELRAAGPRRGLGAKVSRAKFGGGERWCGAVPGLKAERSPYRLTSGGWGLRRHFQPHSLL